MVSCQKMPKFDILSQKSFKSFSFFLSLKNMNFQLSTFVYKINNFDHYTKLFLILYPPLENSTTRIAIVCRIGLHALHLLVFDWTKAPGISDHCHLKWQSC
jgi:hypothetical protein